MSTTQALLDNALRATLAALSLPPPPTPPEQEQEGQGRADEAEPSNPPAPGGVPLDPA